MGWFTKKGKLSYAFKNRPSISSIRNRLSYVDRQFVKIGVCLAKIIPDALKGYDRICNQSIPRINTKAHGNFKSDNLRVLTTLTEVDKILESTHVIEDIGKIQKELDVLKNKIQSDLSELQKFKKRADREIIPELSQNLSLYDEEKRKLRDVA